jgi:hypothetical protein
MIAHVVPVLNQDPPRSLPVFVACQQVTAPLATRGRLDPEESLTYSVLGIETDVIRHKGVDYTVLSAHLLTAREAIIASLEPNGPALKTQTQGILLATIPVPHRQELIGGTRTEAYEILGIDTIDLCFDEQYYTVLTTQAFQVKELYKHAKVCPSAGGVAACGVGGVTPVPIAGLHLRDYYEGPPPVAVTTLARLFGVRFLRILNDNHTAYWVLAGQPSTEIALTRLGLYV